jgi:chemotaxis protein methyltransferase CheR
MSPEDFEFTARLLREKSGFLLTRDKGYLVENRLVPVVRDHGFESVTDLVAALKGGSTALQAAMVDAMLPKDTGFFRDWKPFRQFQSVVLPNIVRTRGLKKTYAFCARGAPPAKRLIPWRWPCEMPPTP